MCGIFGYITKEGRGPDLARLRRIATETELRGHHAFGLAWFGQEGTIHTFKRPGAATSALNDLDACRGAAAVIGHCRWATHGDPGDNRNNHPHPAGRGWFVHNGVVLNYQTLIDRYGFDPESECDSEVLGMLMARSPGPLGQRAARMARLATGTLAVLGLWRAPTRFLVVRSGRPLYFGETAAGFYFGSMPGELPGRVAPIADQYAGVLSFDAGRLRHQAFRIGG
jgi:glucosamine--fructose-6-phosphate aminotransferase (isomerizing)